MEIHSAKFLTSAPSVNKCPETTMPEYAFIGRSNVGKSTLINMLTGRQCLAKTSSTPGKTMLINFFVINQSWMVVDLPGYGYARRSRDSREALRRMIDGYVLERRQMVNLFLLIDSRLEPQKIDLEFMEFLGENQVPFSIVFTKIDKLGREAARRNIEAYKRTLREQWEELPPIFMTSGEDGRGRQELLDAIEQMNLIDTL